MVLGWEPEPAEVLPAEVVPEAEQGPAGIPAEAAAPEHVDKVDMQEGPEEACVPASATAGLVMESCFEFVGASCRQIVESAAECNSLAAVDLTDDRTSVRELDSLEELDPGNVAPAFLVLPDPESCCQDIRHNASSVLLSEQASDNRADCHEESERIVEWQAKDCGR